MIVVGGGPAGLLSAKEASSKGEKVVVYEEHKEVGKPVQCAGLVSRSGLDELGVDYADVVLNEIRGARAYSPSGKVVEFKKKRGYALVIDREKLDKEIAREAESSGVKLELGKRITSIGDFGDDVVVGADGASSQIARRLGINRKLLVAYQVENRMRTDLDFVELHFGSFAPGFFAWVIPVDENLVRMGLAYNPEKANEIEGYNPESALKFFAKLRGYPWNPTSKVSGLIPIYDGKPAVYGNVALVGDAAAQVKASTGGGIVIGGICARILGRVVGEGMPLSEYESRWKARFSKELSLHLAVHKFYSSLSDSDFEELFDLADPDIIHLAEKHAEMENLSKFAVELARYLALHPIKAMKMYKFLKYVDTSLIRL